MEYLSGCTESHRGNESWWLSIRKLYFRLTHQALQGLVEGSAPHTQASEGWLSSDTVITTGGFRAHRPRGDVKKHAYSYMSYME